MDDMFEHGNASSPKHAAVKALVEKIIKFQAHETEMCPYCGQHVTSLQQVGRSVYGSCGCRLWQGSIPAVWK